MFPSASVTSDALRDFWSVYQDQYARIQAETLVVATRMPAFAAVIASTPKDVLDKQDAESRARMVRAFESGDWTEYDADLRQQGDAYARMGIPIADWFVLVAGVKELLVPALIERYGPDSRRLAGAISAMQAFMDNALSLIGESYLRTKESLLASSEVRYRSIFEGSPLPKWVFDKKTLRFLAVNDAAVRQYGWSREEMLRLTIRDIRPESEVAALDADVARSTREPRIWTHRRRDGSTVRMEVRAQDIDFDGAPARLVVAVDVSDRERVVELEMESRRIQEANRLKSEFLANMSHELRTPLNAILGFAELLHDEQVGPLAVKQKEFLADILGSGRHLLQLVNDVLDLAKVESGKLEFFPETIDVAKLVGEVTSVLRGVAAQKRIAVSSSIPADLGVVQLDPGRLKQVLYNYLSNALKFTPDGGRVTVRVVAEKGERLRLEIEDTGPGIAESEQSRLFVEFQQLDAGRTKRHGGTGLGLALTRRIVEAQGGSVGVRSKPGEGSTFHAVLPQRARAGATVVAGPALVDRGGEILVVEDDASDRGMIVAALEGAGYRVEVASSGSRALALARDRRFEAITLDLLLPDMSGLDVLASVRREGPNATTPVVVVTVVAETRSVGGFVVQDVLPKPIEGARLLGALDRAGVRPQRDGRVLVVDDDPASLRLMDAALSQLGYRTTCRGDAVTGLAAATEAAPIAVVLDLMMPGVDGFAFLERFRALPGCERVPVLIWSAKDLTSAETVSLRRSAQAVLSKGTGNVTELLREMASRVAPGGAAKGAKDAG